MKARFIGYLRMQMASTVSSALGTSTASRKRCASDSVRPARLDLIPPHERDPWLFALATARSSLVFIDPETNGTTVLMVT